MITYWCERAWLGQDTGVSAGVAIAVADGRITSVTAASEPGPEAVRLRGLVVPGFANCHSHAFHRALRARAQRGEGSFWTWRDQMYAVATRLDPDSMHRLARATYAEMAAAGITAVGEFHYLHHGPEGIPYADPNAMGHAVIAAAREAGLRIALLDTCYLRSGFGRPVEGVQARFSDGDAERWAARAGDLAGAYTGAPDVVVGAAIHSVRAVPAEQLPAVATWARERRVPLHVHLSEQPAENEQCRSATDRSPTQLLADCGVLGPATSVVHATHLTLSDITLLGGSRSNVCLCPTTERDLADGVGPSRPLATAGATLTLGTDSHAVIDMAEEMRAVETDERLVSRRRGSWQADELLTAATSSGQSSLGFSDAGRLVKGTRADLVCLCTGSLRTAGTGRGAETAVFAATAADVTDVIADGRRVVAGGRHTDLPDAARELDDVITSLMGER
jgi:formiminoglutamate deiminase